jgi:hypothetical protein
VLIVSSLCSLARIDTVALNSAQLAQYGGGYPSSACGKTITISYKGKTAQATMFVLPFPVSKPPLRRTACSS